MLPTTWATSGGVLAVLLCRVLRCVLCYVLCRVLRGAVLDPHPLGHLSFDKLGTHAGEVSEDGGCVFPGPSALSSEGDGHWPQGTYLRASLGFPACPPSRLLHGPPRRPDVRPLRHSLRIRSTEQHTYGPTEATCPYILVGRNARFSLTCIALPCSASTVNIIYARQCCTAAAAERHFGTLATPIRRRSNAEPWTLRLSIATSTRYRRRTGSRALAAAAAASPLHRAVGSASRRSSPAMPARENGTRQSSGRHRSTLSLQKTEITIHVYDLLPVSVTPADLLVALFGSLIPQYAQPGRVSSVLWTVGASLLHSGVVINGREYAYGGHDKRGVTGVYWTKPKTEPPGGTFRCEILHGFTLASQEEIDATLRHASDEFLGTSYNLLTRNCNHFTSYLCQKLTGSPSPGWLNRAASIGVALPCVVPREWIEPPEYDTADGELLDEDEQHTDEHSRMLGQSRPHFLSDGAASDEATEWDSEEERRRGGSGKGKQVVRDSAGRQLPAAERAPTW
ncbi:hypothetical protein Purlil1_8014 [Purpureocillium lilacinum]|uniref:PPPDE domain-containing protein n=1 Tax=Purpureocillium lilacinum TaxID=33203 RepID=A0ABR0BVL4_PURLI|nr:hypothetical protein Purlil1_8014 [Purpureocillium lilacinum]